MEDREASASQGRQATLEGVGQLPKRSSITHAQKVGDAAAVTPQAALQPAPAAVASGGDGCWATRHLQAAAQLATFPGALDVEGAAAVLQLPTHEAASLLARLHVTPTAALQEAAALGRGQEPGLQAEAEVRFVSHTLRRLGEWAAAYQTAGGWRGALAAAREHLADIERLLELLVSVGADISGSGASSSSSTADSKGARSSGSSSGAVPPRAAAATGGGHSGPSSQLETVARIAAGLTDEVFRLLHALGLAARLEQPCTSLLQRLEAAPDARASTSVQLGTAAVLDCLGLAKQEGQHYDAAEADRRRSYDLRVRCLGPQHPDTLRALVALADSICDGGRHAEVQALLEQALELQQEVLGEEHPDVARAHRSLAWCSIDQGRLAEAEGGFQRALQLLQAALGEEHPDVAKTYRSLAWCSFNQGRLEEAEGGFQRALQLLQAALGEEHPASAGALYDLASAFLDRGEYTQALALFQQALTLQQSVLGEAHVDTIYTSVAISRCLGGLQLYADAEAAARKAHTLASGALGEAHSATCAALERMACVVFQQHRHAEAESLFCRLLPQQQQSLGHEHPEVARTLACLGACAYEQERYEGAVHLYGESLALCLTLHGEDDLKTARAHHNLACALVRLKQWHEEELHWRRALSVRLRLLGPEHEHTRTTYKWLRKCQRGRIRGWGAWAGDERLPQGGH